jgi:soluble lytic murein transglycosylase-like protein
MKYLTIVMLLIVILLQNLLLTSKIHPVLSSTTSPNKLQVAVMKAGLGDPGKKILDAVVVSARQTGLSEAFIIALMYTESSFNTEAVSSMHYQGLMQIPQKVAYPDANTLIGSRIFLEKLKITKGDYRKALCLYKGWPIDHSEGKRQADKVIKLALKLKENMIL